MFQQLCLPKQNILIEQDSKLTNSASSRYRSLITAEIIRGVSIVCQKNLLQNSKIQMVQLKKTCRVK